MIRPVHPNVDRIFVKGEWNPKYSPSPQDKFYRHRPDDKVQRLADEIYKYVTIFKLTKKAVDNIIKSKFNSSVGNQTFEIFLDRKYGCGMRPRKKTLAKYEFLLSRLKEIHDSSKYNSCNAVDL